MFFLYIMRCKVKNFFLYIENGAPFYANFLCLIAIYIITGAPIMGVTAFSGIMLPSGGNTQIRLHSRATAEPMSAVHGISNAWLSVFRSIRVICGTVSPIKATGPQYAVVTAACMPVTRSR